MMNSFAVSLYRIFSVQQSARITLFRVTVQFRLKHYSLSIVIQSFSAPDLSIYGSDYYRWDANGGERDILFQTLSLSDLGSWSRKFYGVFPKAGSQQAVSILEKVYVSKTLQAHMNPTGKYKVYWVRVPGYFCQFFTDPPMTRSIKTGKSKLRGEVKSISFLQEADFRVVHALLNSSTYFVFYTLMSGGRHINPSDVYQFPLDLKAFSKDIKEQLINLSRDLEDCMTANTSQWKKSGLLIDSVDSKLCKDVLDQIDEVLGNHYDFTKDETDYIINYDIKYRMGDELFDDEEDDE